MKTRARLLALVLLVVAGYACDRPTPVAPAESTLTITANPTRITVDGEALITILARKADGTAVNPGTEINFSTTLGTIDIVAVTDVRGLAEATLRGDGRIGMATVTADSGAAATATIEIQIGALASSISFTANPQTINKDLPKGGERINLKATVYDDLNNVVPGVAVVFEAEIGTLESGGSVETNNKGVARDTLVVKEARNVTDGVFTITARTAGDGGVEIAQDVTIDVVGFAFDISLTVTPTSIPVTGGVVQLAALVRDDFGDAAAGENVNFITSLGTLASGGGLIPTDQGGQAFDTLTITEADLAALPTGATGITVSAEVAGSGGALITSDPFTIALQTEEPIAGFDVTTISGLTVTFTNTTTGDAPLTYEWDFGDGTISNAAGATVTYTYAAAGTYSVSLTATNLGGSDTITKDVVVAAEPNIDVAPTGTISFGSASVAGNEFVDRDVTITNTGSAELIVSVVSTSGGAFKLVPAVTTPFTLVAGETRVITVRFDPSVVGTNQTDSLTITSNDPNDVTVTRTLTGNGTT